MCEGIRKKYNAKKNVIIYAEGEFTILALTSSDRVSLDQRRLLVKITKMLKFNCYKL